MMTLVRKLPLQSAIVHACVRVVGAEGKRQENSDFQPGVILPSRGHLRTSGNIFGCPTWGATNIL